MRRLLVLGVVLVLLVVMVSSVSAHIFDDPPEPDVVPTDQISLNNIIIDPPPEDPVTAAHVIREPPRPGTENIVGDPPEEDAVQKVREAAN